MFNPEPREFAEFKYIALCSKEADSLGFDRIMGAHTKEELYRLIETEDEFNYFIIVETQEEHRFSTKRIREATSTRRL